MSQTIAIAGKGGSGKTTVAALLVRLLVEAGKRGDASLTEMRVEKTGRPGVEGNVPSFLVLGVDADPNSCLGLALGVTPEVTVAEIRDDALEGKLQQGLGMERQRAVELAVHQAVTEARGFDLLTMGLPEGPSCYCAVNHILRKYLDAAAGHYPFIVIDCEAGMEHLSRRTTNKVDHLVIVSDPTAVGVATARRILGLSERLPIEVAARHVVWNKVVDGAPLPKEAAGLPVLARVPFNQEVLDLSMRGGTVFELGADNPCVKAVAEMLVEKLQVATRQGT